MAPSVRSSLSQVVSQRSFSKGSTMQSLLAQLVASWWAVTPRTRHEPFGRAIAGVSMASCGSTSVPESLRKLK
eukprot:s2127_g13.t1